MSAIKSKKKHSGKFKKPLGKTNIPDDDELQYLEKVVLETSSNIFEDGSSEDDSDEEISRKKPRQDEPKKPAWVDEDDKLTVKEVAAMKGRKMRIKANESTRDYETITKRKFHEVMGVPKWSKSSTKNDNLNDLLNTCGKFIRKPKDLRNTTIEFKKLKHLNYETKVEGPFISVIKFHPKSTVAMVAGVSGVVSLFEVDGKQNSKLQSIQFKNYPIHCGSFLKKGDEFLIGSQHYEYFYSHNLMTGKSIKVNHSKLTNITKTKNFCVSPNDEFIAVCGNSGQIFLLAASTKEYLHCFQMNCNVTALSFNQDGSFLYSHGEDGEIYIWDMKTWTCIRKFYDDGCLIGSSISVSNNDQFIACGSDSGVVNVYDGEDIKSGGSVPIKRIYNLVTSVSSIAFNSTNELLAIASRKKENSVKLVHCPSMTVYSNFPHFQSKMKKPLCLDFSPNSGFLAIGDSGGSAHLFRLKHYGNY